MIDTKEITGCDYIVILRYMGINRKRITMHEFLSWKIDSETRRNFAVSLAVTGAIINDLMRGE